MLNRGFHELYILQLYHQGFLLLPDPAACICNGNINIFSQISNFSTYPIALSNWFMAQYAELRALKTEPLNFNEPDPILRADSKTVMAEWYKPADKSS